MSGASGQGCELLLDLLQLAFKPLDPRIPKNVRPGDVSWRLLVGICPVLTNLKKDSSSCFLFTGGSSCLTTTRFLCGNSAPTWVNSAPTMNEGIWHSTHLGRPTVASTFHLACGKTLDKKGRKKHVRGESSHILAFHFFLLGDQPNGVDQDSLRPPVLTKGHLAMGQNLWLHFGVDEHPFAPYFDVHQGYRLRATAI